MTKSIPSLLALAVTSSLALAQDPAPRAGGWVFKEPGTGVKYDGGEAFGLRWTNRLQVHWTFENNEDTEDVNTFDVRRARTTLAGHVFHRDIQFLLNLDGVDSGASGDGALKDGWVQWNFCNCDSGAIGLRVGQGKTQFGLEGTGTSAGLWFVERSIAARQLSDARSTGAWLNGVMADNRLRWTAGVMNGATANGLGGSYIDVGEESANSDNEPSFVFAVNFDPLGDFFGGSQTRESWRQGDWRSDETALRGTVGAALEVGNGRDAAGTDIDSLGLNVNTAWNVSGFSVLGEYFMRTDDQQDVTPSNEEEPRGWAATFGYLLPASGDSHLRWGFGLRASEVESDGGGGAVDYLFAGIPEGTVREISVVVNAFYHGHACKTQFEITHQDIDFDGAVTDLENIIARIGFQLEI